MSIIDQFEALARGGRLPDAVALVERGASEDAEAMFILANWRLWGLNGPRDLAQTHSLLDRSAAAGSIEAARLRATLVGNGSGVPADPEHARALLDAIAHDPASAEQLALLDAMKLAFPAPEMLSSDPEVRLVRNLFSAAECAYLIARAAPQLRPSMILDQRTGQPRPHPVRTSHSMNFGPSGEDLVVHALNRRLAALTRTDVAAGEPLHILRYSPGQEFRPHLDAIDGATNQRLWTALVYLNRDFDGDETVFSELDLTVLGEPGDCLIFRVANEDGSADQRLRHAGQPVTAGVKWLASRWIRVHPFSPEIARRQERS